MPLKGPRHSTGSAAPIETVTYAIRDIVLAKVKGHPAWPARIIDPHTAPRNLQDERKIASKNSYLVKFFQTGDHAWMNSKEMSKLDPPEIKAFIDNPNKKGADLRAAYEIALAPQEWEADVEAASREYEEHLKALEMDELEGENSETPALPSKSKPKRKRAVEVKTPQDSTKKRKAEVLQPTNGSVNASATPEPTSVGTKKRGRKREEPVPATVASADVVRDWRHKLQRIFLGKTEVTAAMMTDIDQTFKDIEMCKMETEWLTSSKLGKVLKRIGALEDGKVPLDDKYQIRRRSRQLQEQWRVLLGIGEEAQRAQPTVEASNAPSRIPSVSAEVVAQDASVVKVEEEAAAPFLPATNYESMDIDRSGPGPLELGPPALVDPQEHEILIQANMVTQDDPVEPETDAANSGHSMLDDSEDLKPAANGNSTHKADTEMQEVEEPPAIVAETDVAADDDDGEEERMDLAGHTPSDVPALGQTDSTDDV